MLGNEDLVSLDSLQEEFLQLIAPLEGVLYPFLLLLVDESQV